jgi:uncharacterized protein (DUF2252 family)
MRTTQYTNNLTNRSSDPSEGLPSAVRPLQKFAHLGLNERVARGKAARREAPRSSHARWEPSPNRVDPIALLEMQGETRVPELVPIRYGRMIVSPFAFFRGAALIMAADLATTPRTGLISQLCGDAHLSNFGAVASPERQMLFDINDFDETLLGPWEWDVKRLAASFEIAGRELGFTPADRAGIVMRGVQEYRERMRQAAAMRTLDAWYAYLNAEQLLDWIRTEVKEKRLDKPEAREAVQGVAKARTRDHIQAFAKLTGEVDGQVRIVSNPPLIVPIEDLLAAGVDMSASHRSMQQLLLSYRRTLARAHHPLEEYRFVHMARKVVGVGSVGTRCWILLLLGRDDQDPLLLQTKEAQPSVLEGFLGRSKFPNHGQRVVLGQRLMQAASDIFLGWQRVKDADGHSRDYYVRQLHDWKGSAEVENMRVQGATLYARVCGATLARAHARSGDRIGIASYLGRRDMFDRAIAEFASAYADQNERDYETFVQSVIQGRIRVYEG